MITKKLKYPKNPRTLLEREDVTNYLFYLEDNGDLGKLEPSFLAYYVLADVLLNEVNNGGFEQYLTNSSVATLPYLESSAKLVGNTELYAIVSDLVSEVKRQVRNADILSIKNIDFCDEFEDLLSDLDNRFYDFDDKYDLEKIVRQYYQNHIPSDKCEIQIVKQRETDSLRYFVKNVDDVSILDATNSFVDFLNEFAGVKWKIEIMKFGGVFRLHAIDDTNSIDLDKVFAHFTDSDSALKMLKYEEITIRNIQNGTDSYDISIKPSGFEKNEFIMKRFCSMRSKVDGPFKISICSSIILGYMNLTYEKYDLQKIEQILINRATAQNNLLTVYEEDCTMLRGQRKVLFEK